MLVMEPNRGQDEDLPWKLRGRYIRGAPKDWACLVSDLSLVTHFRVGSSNRAIDLFGGWMFKLVIRKGVLCRRIFGYTVNPKIVCPSLAHTFNQRALCLL